MGNYFTAHFFPFIYTHWSLYLVYLFNISLAQAANQSHGSNLVDIGMFG